MRTLSNIFEYFYGFTYYFGKALLCCSVES